MKFKFFRVGIQLVLINLVTNSSIYAADTWQITQKVRSGELPQSPNFLSILLFDREDASQPFGVQHLDADEWEVKVDLSDWPLPRDQLIPIRASLTGMQEYEGTRLWAEMLVNGEAVGDRFAIEVNTVSGLKVEGYVESGAGGFIFPDQSVQQTASGGTDSVTADAIATDAVGAAELADNAVDSGAIQDESISTSKLADGAVTSAKIDSSEVQSRVTGTCTSGSSIRAIGATGAVTCEANGAPVWGLSGPNAYYNTGNVGIGASDPVRPLQLHGATPTLRLSGDTNNPVNAGTVEFAESRDQAEGNMSISYNGSSNNLLFRSWNGVDIIDRLTLTRDTGNFGIHTTAPTHPLDVNGSARFRDNVGIGTDSPTEMLTVNGNIQLSTNFALKGSNGELGFPTNLGDGSSGAQLSNLGSIDLIMDSANTSSGRSFQVMHNGADRSTASPLMTLLENGNLTVEGSVESGSGGFVFPDQSIQQTAAGGSDSVTADEIAADAVGASELADNAVDTGAVQDANITTAKLANGAVTSAKINANEVQRRVTGVCTPGSSIRAISSTGTVTCDAVNPSVWNQSGPNIYYNSGNVGIGTSSPGEKLVVSGNIQISSNSALIGTNGTIGFLTNLGDVSGGTQLSNLGSIDLIIDSTNASSGRSFRVMHDGADRSTALPLMTVMESGNVGIGTDSPLTPMQIEGGTREYTVNSGGFLQIGSPTSHNLIISSNDIDARLDGGWTSMNLARKSGQVTIGRDNQPNAKLGIGIFAPRNPLDLAGWGSSSGGTSGDGYVVAQFRNSHAGFHTALSVNALAGQDAIVYLAEDDSAVWDIRNDSTGVLPNTPDAFTIRWQDDGTDDNALTINKPKASGISLPGFIFEFDGVLRPNHDDGWDIGETSYRWKTIYASNSTISTSDIRAKHDVRPLANGLDSIMNLRPVTYVWNKYPEDGLHYGLIAQEVLEVLPVIVDVPDDPEEMMGLSYQQLIPVLIKSIQQQQAQIETLEHRLADLEGL